MKSNLSVHYVTKLIMNPPSRGVKMGFRFLNVILLAFSISIVVQSVELKGDLECDDVCYYTPVNISAASLKNKIRIEIYKTGEPLYPDILQVSGDDSQLIFFSEDQKRMSAIKKRLSALDKKAKFVKNVGGQAMIMVQIHAIEEQGIDQFRFAWEGSVDKTRDTIQVPRASFGTNERGNFSVDLNLGNLASSIFKFAFDFSKTKAWTHRAASWTVFKRNEEDLSVSNNTTLYRQHEKAISPDKESAGFSANGKVYISDNNLIKIKNFSLYYSQPTGDPHSLVSSFNLSNMSFDIKPGETRFLASNKVYMKAKSDKESLIFFQDRVSDSTEVTLLFSISAELADENQNDMKIDYSLKEDDIRKLRPGDNNSIPELIRSIYPVKAEGNIFDVFGKKTGIQLDRRFLTLNNYDRYLTVKIINPAFDNLVLMEQKIQAQALATKPLLYNFVDDFDKRCKQNAKLCSTWKLVLEIGIDKDRESDLLHIPSSKFIITDNPNYVVQKIEPYRENQAPPARKKGFWESDED